MSDVFELWDTETANRVGEYDSREAALAVVRAAAREHGPGVVGTLALGVEDANGDTVVIAAGADLLRLAESGRQGATAAAAGTAAAGA